MPKAGKFPSLTELTEFQVGWVVGIYEGEGNLSLNRNVKGDKLYGRYWRVRVVMTDRDILDRLQCLLGGRVRLEKRNFRSSAHREAYVWDAGGTERAFEILVMIYPYLSRRRQDQIVAGLEILRTANPKMFNKEWAWVTVR